MIKKLKPLRVKNYILNLNVFSEQIMEIFLILLFLTNYKSQMISLKAFKTDYLINYLFLN